MRIILTEEQATYAESVGIARHASHRGRADNDISGGGERIHKIGACGELAVSLATGWAWDGKLFDRSAWEAWRDADGGDVRGLEVKTAISGTSLILQPRNSTHAVYVCVRYVGGREYEILGWIHGREAKVAKYWRADVPRPAFFVPPRVLRPLCELA